MKKNRTLFKILYALLISSFTVVVILVISYTFRLKVINTTALPKDMEGFPPLGKQYLFLISEEKIRNYFLKNPTVKNVTIVKKYPHTLVIDIQYRNKLAEVFAKNGLFEIDVDGVIFNKLATSSASTRLNLTNSDVGLGTIITQNSLIEALKIVNIAKDKNIYIVDISQFENGEISLVLSIGTHVIIGTNAKAEEIVSSLQMILKHFTIEGKSISKIDFRFDKPYITSD